MLIGIKIILYSAAILFIFADSKNRDVSPILWIIAAILLCFIGLWGIDRTYISALAVYIIFIIAYFYARPKSELIYCVNCFKKKMIDKPYCPHCFAVDERLLDAEIEKNKD